MRARLPGRGLQGAPMKIKVTDAVRDEADEREFVTEPPIECPTAKAIATAIVALLDARRVLLPGDQVELPAVRSFAATGAITMDVLREELGDVFNLLELDPDDLPLLNALWRYFYWCRDREGGPAWGSV